MFRGRIKEAVMLFLSSPAGQRSDLGLDLGWDCCLEWKGGSSARRILKETNSCSFLESYPDKLTDTEHDFPPLIPRKFSLTK